jgi:DNA-binding NarL/FixJ family response regulator
MTRSVLLVEDEAEALDSLARSLNRAGYACLPALSAGDALTLVRSATTVDVCVVDVRLGTDEDAGIALIPELRRATLEAPLIVVTAFADVDKVKRALNSGAAFFIEKPFAASELLDAIQRVLAEKGSVSHLVDRALSAAALTDKEATIARLLLKGLPSGEIARLQGNSDKTIRQHVSRIYAKFGVNSRSELFHHVFEH